jgi:hypothetical protein
MPDMQTALSKALTQNRVREIPSDWDDSNTTTKESTVTPHRFTPTNNVTRETFNFVRDNPGFNAKQIIERMEEQGFNGASVGSLLGQMARNKLLVLDKDTREYRALAKQYAPIKVSILKASREQEKKEAKAAARAARAAKKAMQPAQPKVEQVVEKVSKPAPQAIPAAAPTPKLLTAAQVLETLSIKEAHILYRELQTMFG